jgi:hypothetical protein
MMVGVEIAQAHPFVVRQRAKARMRLAAGVSGLIRKALWETVQFAHVGLKLHGWSAADVLVKFGRSFESLGHGIGIQSAAPLRRTGGMLTGAGGTSFSPMNMRYASLRWHTIW